MNHATLYIDGACSQTNAHESTGVSDPNKMKKMLLVGLMALLVIGAQALDPKEIRRQAITHNITSILVFGDSSVDPGNNNRLSTTFKSNFPPYGKDFYNGSSTGRFTNGRLPTDFIGMSPHFELWLSNFSSCLCYNRLWQIKWVIEAFVLWRIWVSLSFIVAEDLGFGRIVAGFLEKRGLNKEELLHGVSFASAATGYDDLTANFTVCLFF